MFNQLRRSRTAHFTPYSTHSARCVTLLGVCYLVQAEREQDNSGYAVMLRHHSDGGDSRHLSPLFHGLFARWLRQC